MRLTLDHRHIVMAGAPQVARSASKRGALPPPQGPACRLLAALSLAALAVSLSGCVGGTPSIDQSASAEPSAASPSAGTGTDSSTRGPATSESQAAESLADTSGAASAEVAATEAVKQTVTDALGGLAAGTPKPATDQVSDALTGAGIAPGVLEVSQSRTPTGLEADAIEAAVLQGSDCVIGQVRDGAVAVTVLPVLASGKCFVGS